MAALDFPDSPALEEEFGSEGLIWIWNGEQWIIKGGGAGGAGGGSGFTFSQDTAPFAADVSEVGDTWFNTSTGDSFVWTVDGDSQQWVQFAPGAGGGSGGGGGGGGSTEIEVGTKVGVISSWATDSPIPADCLVCDGQAIPADAAYDQLRALHGTNVPDLRDKFLLGASATKALRSVGGAETHILTPGEMPSHTHVQDAHGHSFMYGGAPTAMPYTTVLDGAGGIRMGVGLQAYGDVGIYPATPTNQYTGGNAAHNNMPPYYAVIFIIQAKPTLATVAASSSAGGGGSGFTFVTDTQPAPTKAGDTWFDTSTAATGGTSWVAMDEGTGELIWVQFAPGVAAMNHGPLLFSTIVERNTYYAAPPPTGTRCFVRLCEWMWSGTAWVGIPFTQAATMVSAPDANALVIWTYGIPFASWLGGVAVASSHPNNPNVCMADPAGYDPKISLRFVVPGFANSTWRWEVAAWGYLDGYLD